MAQTGSTGKTKLFLKPSQSLHKSIKPIVIIANCFGLLPVGGVTCNSVEGLNFRWFSLKSLYSFFLLPQAFCGSLLYLICLFKEGLSCSLLTGFCLYIVWLVAIAAYFYLAVEWPKFMKRWNEVDLSMQRAYNYPSSLNIRFKLTITITFIGATVLHVLMNLYTGDQPVVVGVKSSSAIIGTQYIHAQLLKCLLQINFIISVLTWVFNDTFVILISTALALRFKQITDRVLIYGANAQSLDFWSEIRADYIKLFKLCQLVNKYISFQITLSIASNTWCILTDLFIIVRFSNSEQSNQVIIYYIELFWCSFTVICIILYTSWVNDESERFAATLNSIPSKNYNLAIKLLLEQMPFNPVALCGNNIFECRRGLILNILGTVIAYELLLIQFNDVIISH